ncbi:hypothetical protein QMT40_002513 [Parvibaculaceae bacterium PLY_AMNH_Bact1]|nr:hypothetical protein QMT40_002513 [Parvibaculaceae bacterium PLY_AMNH_Bact1]
MDKEQQIQLGEILVKHWKSLFSCHCIPSAGKFKPDASLKDILPHILILEVDSSDIKLSLLGPGHDGRFPINPTGLSYLETLPPERRYPTMLRVQAMLQHKCGARLEFEERTDDGSLASTLLTVVPFAPDTDRSACLVAVAPPDTKAGEDAANSTPFLGRPLKNFDYLDLGFGVPSPIVEKIMGVEAPSPDLKWPDLKSLVE